MKKYLEETVIAKPNYCVPATLEMILRHFSIFTLSQDDIAAQLQIIPAIEEYNSNMWGAQIGENTINEFFISNRICLREKYISISYFADELDFAEKINVLLDNDISIICGYNYSWLYGNRDEKFQHVSIIVGISLESGKVELLDPGPRNAGYNSVAVDVLFDAIRVIRDGLWCITTATPGQINQHLSLKAF